MLVLLLFLVFSLLLTGVESDQKLNFFQLGRFSVTVDERDPYLRVTVPSGREGKEDRLLFQTVQGWPFLAVGISSLRSDPIVDGNYNIHEWNLVKTPHQSITSITSTRDNEEEDLSAGEGGGGSVVVEGRVWGLIAQATYSLRLFTVPGLPEQLHFHIDTLSEVQETAGKGYNRVFLNYWCNRSESFHGFGTQYSYWNLKGHRVPIIVAEQGIGRGLQPITTVMNMFANGAGGDWSTSYAPKPLYVTNFNRSVLIENGETSFFDLRDDDAVTIEVWSPSIRGRILDAGSGGLAALVESATTVTGRMRPPPAWTQAGAVVGLEGGAAEVREHVATLLGAGVPVTGAGGMETKAALLRAYHYIGVWIQDWVGLRHAYDGDRLIWNWELDRDYYSDWHAMVREWHEQDIRVLTYVNPYFSSPRNLDNHTYKTDYYEEGIKKGYFVHKKNGETYIFHSGSIDFCMLDVTNPAARTWMKDILKNEMLGDSMASGWMADFGEYLPFDAKLANGQDGAAFHNSYPDEWAKINQEAVREANRDDDVLYFMRAAWLKSPGHTAMYWVGDQLVTWDGNDGMKTVVISTLSSGLSGHSISHSDIGGYTMESKGPFGITRTEELLLRWIELSAFGAALFRTHIGSSTDRANAQVYDNVKTLKHFAIFSKIFIFLADYRKQLMEVAAARGLPIVRPLAMHYAGDDNSWKVTEQYLFGEDFLVAPVMKCGRGAYHHVNVKVFIPSNSEWVHVWTNKRAKGGEAGRFISVSAPIGQIPVFYKLNSTVGKQFANMLQSEGIIDFFSAHSGKDASCQSSFNDNEHIVEYFDDHVAEDSWAAWLGVSEHLRDLESTIGDFFEVF